MNKRSVMPCYRFRFSGLELPLYYYGHALPPPIVKVILRYAYEMTVHEDMETLQGKLESTLLWLHNYKDVLKEHLTPYQILREDGATDRKRDQNGRLCHRATVNLATALSPRPLKRARIRPLYRSTRTLGGPRFGRCLGFVLPEMSNYV